MNDQPEAHSKARLFLGRKIAVERQMVPLTQLHLVNHSTGLVAPHGEVVAEGAGRRQFQRQMIEPKSNHLRQL